MTGQRNRPVGDRAAGSRFAGDTASLAVRGVALPPDYLEQFTLRMLQDALAQGTSGYWERRAAVLEDARPRRGDFHGRATQESLQARYDRLTADALECRRHAQLFDHDSVDADLVREVLGWDLADEAEAVAA